MSGVHKHSLFKNQMFELMLLWQKRPQQFLTLKRVRREPLDAQDAQQDFW